MNGLLLSVLVLLALVTLLYWSLTKASKNHLFDQPRHCSLRVVQRQSTSGLVLTESEIAAEGFDYSDLERIMGLGVSVAEQQRKGVDKL